VRVMLCVLVVLGGLALAGCAGYVRAPVVPGYGFIFSDFKSPMQTEFNKTTIAEKRGEATSQDILGWVCTGDASIKAAAADGKITTVHHVDYHFWNILGVYSKFTTIVYGD